MKINLSMQFTKKNKLLIGWIPCIAIALLMSSFSCSQKKSKEKSRTPSAEAGSASTLKEGGGSNTSQQSGPQTDTKNKGKVKDSPQNNDQNNSQNTSDLDHSCSDVCEKNLKCGLENDLDKCTAACQDLNKVLRPSVALAMKSCTLESSCSELKEDRELCLNRGVAKVPKDSLDDFKKSICNKIADCSRLVLGNAFNMCMKEFEKESNGINKLGVFNDAFISCEQECITNLSCNDITDSQKRTKEIDSCTTKCGVDPASLK